VVLLFVPSLAFLAKTFEQKLCKSLLAYCDIWGFHGQWRFGSRSSGLWLRVVLL